MTLAVARKRCLNCGAGFTSKAGDRPCPKPSRGREYIDCGKGRHWFVAGAPKSRLSPTAKRLVKIKNRLRNDYLNREKWWGDARRDIAWLVKAIEKGTRP